MKFAMIVLSVLGLGRLSLRLGARVLRTVALAAVVIVGLMASPHVASAQSAENTFLDAQALFDKGEFESSLAKFREAFAASGSPNARIYIARSLAKLGRNAEAHQEMQATVRDASKLAEQEPRYEETRDAAAAEMVVLEGKVAKLIIALSDDAEGASVELNGDGVSVDRIGVPIAVEPGAIELSMTAPGEDLVMRRLDLEAGETKTVTMSFGAAPADDDDDGDVEEEGGGVGLSAVQGGGIAMAALGVAGLVVFAVTGSQAADKFSQIEDDCMGVRCTTPESEEIIDDGKTLETVANVTAVVGGVLLAGGLVMIIFGGDDDDTEKQQVVGINAAAVPLPGGAMLQLGASF